MNNKPWVGILMGFSLVQVAWAAPSAKDIMTQHEVARQVNDVFSNAMITTGGSGAEKVKKFTWWRKLTSDQVHFNTLTRFQYPPEIRGEGILFLEHGTDDNEVLMYLPNFKKIRRVEAQQQSGSFMGSELSYSDIATPHVDDYTHKLLKEETCPGEQNKQVKCFVIESTPISESVRERTGYSKTVNWIRGDNFMMAQGEYYGSEGGLVKKMFAAEIKKVDEQKNKWMAHQVRIENAKNGKYTVLQFSQVKVNQGIPDSTFTQQNLSRAQ